jgi:hypothetical protein
MEKTTINLNGVEVEVTKENGVATVVVNENAFVEAAKEAGLSKKEIKAVDDFRHAYGTAVVDMAVEKAKEIFSEDNSVEEVEVTAPFGVLKSDKVVTKIFKSVETRIPGTNEVVNKPRIKVVTELKAARVSKAHVRSLRDQLEKAILG